MTRRITLAIVAALAALLLSAGLAAAQEPPGAESGTRLEPGLNLVGWVGEPTPVSQLFQQIPRLEAIWAWDAELRDWIVAAPGAPEWLGGLGRVTAGMGLRMQLGGDQPYHWQRSTEPTRGLVKLRTGWNLVAWSGADGAAIGDVAKGIGWSLRSVRRWDAASQQWVTWTSPERTAQVIANTSADATIPGIRRGEALWIEVARAVNWLQPTDILPRLVFSRGASHELQTRVREDLKSVLAFFRDQYGIQADPDFTVYVPEDVDALIQAYEDDGVDEDKALIRALWNRAPGWASGKIVVKQSLWPDDLSNDEFYGGRYLITHEYFHILQGQLSGNIAGTRGTAWLIEGMAAWVGGEHAVFDGELIRVELRNTLLSGVTDDTPTLQSTEKSGNAGWEYSLGRLAIDRLTEDNGPDLPIELWRSLASTEIGPQGRWASTLDWQTAFEGVSGQTVSEFYADFDAWQREQAAANSATANSYDSNWIRGRVTGEGGAPVAGVIVNAIRPEGETSVGRHRRAETAADGSFAVWVPEDGDYRLSVDIDDDCTRYYSNGQLINDGKQWDDLYQARPIKVGQSDVSGVHIQLPPNVCDWQIRGHAVGPNGEPLAGLGILACRPQKCHTGYTIGALVLDGPSPGVSFAAQYVVVASNGSFTVTPGLLGVYILLVLNETCSAWYTSTGLTVDQGMAATITVDNSDSREVFIQVPSWMCRWQIKGDVAQADGSPVADTDISACLEVNGDCVSRLDGSTDGNGTFAITVPAEGNYRLWFNLEGCTIYFGDGGFTTDWRARSTVRVAGRDVRLDLRQISEGMCRHRISGRFVDSSGAPLSKKWINVHWPANSGGVWADPDGRFEIRVPSDGEYTFSIQLRQQPECWPRLGGQALGSPNNPVRVSGADVTGVVLRLPGTIEELCE